MWPAPHPHILCLATLGKKPFLLLSPSAWLQGPDHCMTKAQLRSHAFPGPIGQRGGILIGQAWEEVRRAGRLDLPTKVSWGSEGSPQRNNRCYQQEERNVLLGHKHQWPILPRWAFLYSSLSADSAFAHTSPSRPLASVFSLAAVSWGGCPHA